jgi:formylglycine-generating enzyme required for sulfatase activity
MTQGQWQRFSGSNPSGHGPQDYTPDWNAAGLPFDLRHPVENVTWMECFLMTSRLGLTLPTEAQWEYATRGGKNSVWCSGDEAALLVDVANLADAYAEAHVSNWRCEPWDDGVLFHASAGTFRPNAFGLHDVHGNVWEWCLDGYDKDAYESEAPREDPLVDPLDAPRRVARGADYSDRAVLARCAHRGDDRPDYRSPKVGLRPARIIEDR